MRPGYANTTAVATTVQTFLCPSDPQAGQIVPGLGPNNYEANAGTGLQNGGSFRTADGPDIPDGVFYDLSAVRFADITDGLSNTAAFDETIKGNGINTTGPAPQNQLLQYGQGAGLTPVTASFCAAITSWVGGRGQEWARGSIPFASSNHYLTPNSKTIDCLSGNVSGWLSARSLHTGGVNVLIADGHVLFVKDSVALVTWRALASRSGGEVISGDAF